MKLGLCTYVYSRDVGAMYAWRVNRGPAAIIRKKNASRKENEKGDGKIN